MQWLALSENNSPRAATSAGAVASAADALAAVDQEAVAGVAAAIVQQAGDTIAIEEGSDGEDSPMFDCNPDVN